MSEWIKPKKEDIDLSLDNKDLHIWIESDNFGNRYIEIPLKELKERIKELESEIKN